MIWSEEIIVSREISGTNVIYAWEGEPERRWSGQIVELRNRSKDACQGEHTDSKSQGEEGGGIWQKWTKAKQKGEDKAKVEKMKQINTGKIYREGQTCQQEYKFYLRQIAKSLKCEWLEGENIQRPRKYKGKRKGEKKSNEKGKQWRVKE